MSQDVKILDPLTFPLTGHALIEASAGTGKTFTLAFLYLRLIIQHGQADAFIRPLSPPEILVVTFTNAATAELRDRIRARLVEAADLFQGQSSDDALLNALKDQTPVDQHPRVARQLTLAAQWMDEASISTIHAWCYRMLKEHAFESGHGFDPNLETHEQEWQKQASEDYWRCEYSGLELDALKQVLACWKSPDALVSKVRHYLDKLDYLDLFKGSVSELIQAFNLHHTQILTKIKAEWKAQDYVGQLTRLFDHEAALKSFDLRKLNSGHRQSVLEKLSTWVDDPLLDNPGCFSGKSWLRMSSDGVEEIWKDKPKSPAKHPACLALTELKHQLDQLPELQPALLSHAAFSIAHRIEQSKRQSNSLSQNDLLLRLDQALSSEQGHLLAARIRQQFPVALVDEFQDTDPVQYRIFRRIYLERQSDDSPDQQSAQAFARHCDTGFFMIGDPKQAIYAFRGADIYTYLQARQDSAGNHYTLATNFRSSPDLIASINQLFSLGDQREKGAFLFKSTYTNPVPFIPVKAGKKKLQGLQVKGQAVSALQGWLINQEDKKLTKAQTQESLAQATACHIADLLTLAQQGHAVIPDEEQPERWRALEPFDFAVLVNSFNEANLVRRALQRVGVSSVYLSDRSSVFTSWIASELLELMRATADPMNERRIGSALASPLLRLTIKELEQIHKDELLWETYAGRFVEYQALWQKQGVLPLIYRWIQDFHLAQGVGSRDQGERELTDLLHLGELLHQAATHLDGELALIRFLEESILDPDDNAEAQQLRLETDGQLVRVVTIHKSKGLEYPLVFLPFIGEARRVKKSDNLHVTHSPESQPQVHLSATEDVLVQADQERLAEDLRKLYVALTRARYANWVGLASTEGFNASAMAHILDASSDDLAEKVNQLSAMQLLEMPTSWSAPWQADQHPTEFEASTFPKLHYEPWWIASYSALKQGTAKVIESAQEEQLTDNESLENSWVGETESVKTIHNLPKGSHIGTFLHGILEWTAQLKWVDESGEEQQGFAVLLQSELQAQHRETFLSKCQQRQLEDWEPCLWNWLTRYVSCAWAFTRQETDQSLILANLTPERMSVEMEFWFAVDHVNTLTLDQWITENTLGASSRPKLLQNQLNGMLKGFIDLVIEHQGRYYVIDWKSNWLGDNATAYTQDSMRDAILEKRYDVQYLLYLVALHRYLSLRLPNYDYDRHIGGAAYFFLRGYESDSQGVFFDKPSREVIEGLDKLFMGHDLEVKVA